MLNAATLAVGLAVLAVLAVASYCSYRMMRQGRCTGCSECLGKGTRCDGCGKKDG